MKRSLTLTLTLIIAIVLLACAGLQPIQTPLAPASATETMTQPTQSPVPTETFVIIPTVTEPPSTQAPSEVSFTNNIMPIFERSCIECHGGEKTKEGLDLKTYESLMAGSFNGSVIEAGNAQNSFLVEQIVNGEMPKRGAKLSKMEIQIIIDWVNAGALNN